MPDIDTIVTIIVAGVTGFTALYGAVYLGAKKIGEAIPGDDPVERFALMLEAKINPIAKKIERGVDRLDPTTHGGAGKGPSV